MTITDEQHALIMALADGIRRRGLTTVATLLCELIQPLGFAGSQLVLMFGPLISSTPPERLQQYAALLEDRQALDRLLAALGSRPATTAD